MGPYGSKISKRYSSYKPQPQVYKLLLFSSQWSSKLLLGSNHTFYSQSRFMVEKFPNFRQNLFAFVSWNESCHPWKRSAHYILIQTVWDYCDTDDGRTDACDFSENVVFQKTLLPLQIAAKLYQTSSEISSQWSSQNYIWDFLSFANWNF